MRVLRLFPILLLLAGGATGAPLDLSVGITFGPSAVGFRQIDASVSVWYPAMRGGGAAMSLADYYGDRAAVYAQFLRGAGIAPATVTRYMAAAMHARRDARDRTPAESPLVVVAQGNAENAPDQAILCELLASRGFVVTSVPSPMIAHPMTREDQVGAFAAEQADALEHAITAVSAQYRVAPPFGVVSHSFGARAALLLAMRDPRVTALVSLDGGIGTATGIDSLRAARGFDASRSPAILHLYEDADASMHPDFAFLRSLPARPLRIENIAGAHHVHFTTTGFAAAALPDVARVTKGGAHLDRVMRHIATLTTEFLTETLRPRSHR